MQSVVLDCEAPKRRPTTSLIVMFVLGGLWCGLLALSQGNTRWELGDRGTIVITKVAEPADGWFAGWVFQFCVVGGLLVYLWWTRSRAWVIVLAPIAIQLLIVGLWYAWDAIGMFQSIDPGDWADDSTFADAFVPLVLSALLATAGVGSLAVRIPRARHRDDGPGA